MTLSEKYAEIERIEAEYHTVCCGETLTLGDQLCMAESAPESPWKEGEISEVMERIAECLSRIQAVLEA